MDGDIGIFYLLTLLALCGRWRLRGVLPKRQFFCLFCYTRCDWYVSAYVTIETQRRKIL